MFTPSLLASALARRTVTCCQRIRSIWCASLLRLVMEGHLRGIVGLLKVEEIVKEPEIVAGRFTGRPSGEPCFQAGKLICLNRWLGGVNRKLSDFAESWFYSDSHNDLPLMLAVTHPVAIDPDPVLAAEAAARGWPIASWR